ncbi:elongation factor 1-alpha 1-like [Odontesthes bonariensis]|uniref:elongation factor 1-alpha 1-like n=1 Tax=Odontesthes bonariensis TaxID=219752 RepID=UPI003F585C2D
MKAECERGVTLDFSLFKYVTNNYIYNNNYYTTTTSDSPAHRDSMENMNTGTSQAGVGEFKAGISKSGKKAERTLPAPTSGGKKFIVRCLRKAITFFEK